MNGKRILMIVTVLGIALCGLGLLFWANAIRRWRIPVRQARIIEILDTGYIHGPGDDIRNEHTEDVIVLTEDGQTVTVTIKSMDEDSLPGVGDTIRIYGQREYTSWYEKTGIWFFSGIFCPLFGGYICRLVLKK